MAHQTRSGRTFRFTLYEQTSSWGEASEVLLVLLDYLDFSSLLTGRLVCQAWRGSFSTPIKQLQLEQPASARAALSLGRKAAAAFSNTNTVCMRLLKFKDPPIDMTADDVQPELFGSHSLGRPAAGSALLKQLNKAGPLQHLQLFADSTQTCTCLPALLKPVPQLLVLDLSCCAHQPADLLVLAQHAPSLQELLLHCQAFTTLSGRRIRHGNPEWGRHGGNTRYQPEHLAALAHLPQLQLLECPLATPFESRQQAIDFFEVLGSFTSLTGLHVIGHGKFTVRPPAAAITALSRLTRLRELRCEAGADPRGRWGQHLTEEKEHAVQAKCWGAVLPCMPHLTRLELVEAAACDTLLCAVGRSAPKLQRLVLERDHWYAPSSKEGADAIAHVGHIELLFNKGFSCHGNQQLVQLPGVKRVLFRYGAAPGRRNEMQGGSAWTQETCVCEFCMFYSGRRH